MEQTASDTGKASQSPGLDRADFMEAFGTCFRNGAFLAGRAYDRATMPLEAPDSVYTALRDQFRAATHAERLKILKGYTPLDPAIKSAQIVESEEQSSGLRAMTASQQARLLDLLPRYAAKFGFDAIFVVRNYSTASLLASLEKRILDSYETELRTTCGEVEQLAGILVRSQVS
jgi:urate oxidase